MKIIQKHFCHDGTVNICEHHSQALGCLMQFSLFLPPQTSISQISHKAPLLTYLSGLTCTHDNFTTKAGAYGFAANKGIAIVAPDTSPRGKDVPDDDAYDFGQGAGFYINANKKPWSKHFKMEEYIIGELNPLVCQNFPIQKNTQGITGHSMGGHGAITLALKYPLVFQSISAFAPIVAPSKVPWGQKAFTGYLGDDRSEWAKHDSCALMRQAGSRAHFSEILIDQGSADSFLSEQLKPQLFEDACKHAQQRLRLRLHDGYDHSYYFIQSFIEDHIAHHATILSKASL